MGEAAVDQIAAQLAFQIAEAPTFQVLQYTAAQQAIGGHADPPGAGGSGVATGEAAADQVDQLGILQQVVDGVEQIVLEQGGLPGQGEKEEPALVLSGGDHIVLDYIEYDNRMSRKKLNKMSFHFAEELRGSNQWVF